MRTAPTRSILIDRGCASLLNHLRTIERMMYERNKSLESLERPFHASRTDNSAPQQSNAQTEGPCSPRRKPGVSSNHKENLRPNKDPKTG